MTLDETIQARKEAIKITRNYAARGIVVGQDIYNELIVSSNIQFICDYNHLGAMVGSYETYSGLEISVSKREGTLVIY